MPNPWWLYMIECRGGGIYIGIAIDVDRRYSEHVAGTGAQYTRLNPPEKLLAKREFPNRKTAAQEEYRMKRFSTLEKRQWAWALAARPNESSDSLGG